MKTDLKGRRVTVMGLGRFGGGVGVVRYLLAQGARVTLTDLQRADQLAVSSVAQIDLDQLEQLILGEHREQDFLEADLVVINPGVVAAKNRFVQSALSHGIPVTTEINLFWERCRAKKIVVTGTVGKSTTTSLIHHLLSVSGTSCRLGGNIGISLLPEVDQLTEADWVVLELSSFQLQYLNPLQPRPDVTVVTNIHPNHLDWHGTFDEYRAAKQTALTWQQANDVAILNDNDPDVRNWESSGRRILFGTRSPSATEQVEILADRFVVHLQNQEHEIRRQSLPESLQLPHQLVNLAAALAATAACVQISPSAIEQSLASFNTLPHRLELVTEQSGIRYFNDSKATTPEAAIAALNAIPGPIVLIAGGKDKRVDISEFCRHISEKVKAVALIGETALLMALLLPEYRSGLPYSTHNSLENAVRWARKQCVPGDTLLLSPGCSSDSPFLNYEDRGNRFRGFILNAPEAVLISEQGP